jgi:hypothetical protein
MRVVFAHSVEERRGAERESDSESRVSEAKKSSEETIE